MIEFSHNGHEIREKVEAAMEVVGHNFSVGLELSERSITILYFQAKNHGRDATEAFGDIEEGEIEQCFEEPLNRVLVQPGQTRAAREEAAEKIGELLRKYLVAGIDDEDLIDTGELRSDAESAPIRMTGI